MTREEREQALEWFKSRPVTMSGAKKMYDLAIEALSAVDKDINAPNTDTISRQAAIDAFDKQIWGAIDIPICKEIRTAVKKTIEQLPSAEKRTIKRTETHSCDCISKQDAIDALEKCYTCKHVYQKVSDADTLYCRCRKGCRYEEFKPKRSGESPRRHEG